MPVYSWTLRTYEVGKGLLKLPNVKESPLYIKLGDNIWRRARRELDYVYTGNVPSHPGQHTYCPRCGAYQEVWG
ncbi:MAG: hypothetical protein RXO26_04670 [Caldivirga sp.]|jgi:hypothetical protein